MVSNEGILHYTNYISFTKCIIVLLYLQHCSFCGIGIKSLNEIEWSWKEICAGKSVKRPCFFHISTFL